MPPSICVSSIKSGVWKKDDFANYEVSILTGAKAFSTFERMQIGDCVLPESAKHSNVVCVKVSSEVQPMTGCIFFDPVGRTRNAGKTITIYCIATSSESDASRLKQHMVSSLFNRYPNAKFEVQSSRLEALFWAEMGFLPPPTDSAVTT